MHVEIEDIMMDTADPLPIGPGEWEGRPSSPPPLVRSSSSTGKIHKQLQNATR